MSPQSSQAIIPVFQSNCHVAIVAAIVAGWQVCVAGACRAFVMSQWICAAFKQWPTRGSTMAVLMQAFKPGCLLSVQAWCAFLAMPRGPVL